ncbi:MAG: hypothetical protein Kow00121_57870 [Elainellaceae cyanobacterium]
MLLHIVGNHLWDSSIPWQGLAQVEPGLSPVESGVPAALVFSGPRFFVALIAGLVLAFGFQLLLTNLSVAAGISYLGNRSSSSHHDTSSSSGGVGSTVKTVSTVLGIGTLITVTIALFVACLLAVKLSLINSPVLGAIIGLVIWATYFCLMVWISSTTVGSLVGSVVNAATSGFQALVGTATTAFGAKMARDQLVTTVETAAAAVRREIATGLDPDTMRENLEDYLARLRPSQLDMNRITQEFESIVNDPELAALASSGDLSTIDRQTFVDLISRRSDLSPREVNQLADRLDAVWRNTAGRLAQSSRGINDLVDFLRSGRPEQLLSTELGSRLDRLIDELQQRRQAQSSSPLMHMLNGLAGVVVGRTDLSDLDVEKVLNQLRSAKDQFNTQTDKIASSLGKKEEPGYSVIHTDVETYLLNTYTWEMTPAAINRDFRDVLYDPQADTVAVRRELERLNRMDFVELLQSRGVFTQEEISKISFQLEAIRREVLEGVIAIEENEKVQELQLQFNTYLRSAPKGVLLDQNTLANDLKPILSDSEVTTQRLRDRLSQYDRTRVTEWLTQRGDLTPEEVDQVLRHIGRIFEIVVSEHEGLQAAARSRTSAQWQKLEDYLRNTKRDELNPEGIKQDLRTLLDDPQAGVHDIRHRLSRFDRETLVQLLNQRQDLNEAEINQILDAAESRWYQVRHAPQLLAGQAADQYNQTTQALAEYLRNTGRSELNPEGIQRDLKTLLEDPKVGTRLLRDRLSHVDRETLVQLLSQRQDMTEAEANQVVDQVLETIRGIIRAPRRLARRTQTKVRDFQTSFADYLRNTDKDELNPEGIRRDLQLLFSDPRLGAEHMRDRLSRIDRSTMVALLSQRNDISEEEANQIVNRVLSVRDQFVDQIRAVQFQVQAVIDRIMGRIRSYLNSLDRPELNYEGIRHDMRQLFDDPQAGFESLRDRLSQFDRGTLVAILSSRDDISQADAERIVDQVERARNSVLRRAERIQQQVQHRLEDLKHQAEAQLEETRKAASVASWWLFATALISAIMSALAGGLAVA